MTLRIRVTVLAALAITAAVMLGALVMYRMQMHSIRRTVDDQLRTYAAQIVQTGQNSGWPAAPSSVPSSSVPGSSVPGSSASGSSASGSSASGSSASGSSALASSVLDENAQAQVLAADGSVLAATSMLRGYPAVYTVAPGRTVPVRQKAADAVVPNEVQVVAVRATVRGRPVVVVTGTRTAQLDNLGGEFTRHLLISLPIVLVGAVVAVGLIVGRALRPVERIRRAVTDITSADLSRRVPDPGTDDEIGLLARTMNDMLARIEDASARQRRFVADASHELRSPLAAIRTTLEVGLAHPAAAPWPEVAGRAAELTVRLEGLIAALLALAKADERPDLAGGRPVGIAALLDDIRGAIVTGGTGLTVRVEGAPAVVGDPEALSRLVRNVIDNALRYAATTVTVTAASEPGTVRIEVVDDGPGIPEEQRERVFDRFVRLDGSRARATGASGLGLAIARAIATAHGGTIVVAAPAARGTRVVITLPSEAS